jgi:Fe2+ or Zn2+ uptake regulation protein
MRNRPPRQAVLDAMEGFTRPFSIDALYRSAKEILPGISRATVYRTVTKLLEEGRIRQIAPPSGERLLLTPAMNGKPLIYCETCHTVQPLEDAELQERLARTMDGLGFKTEPAPICLSVRCDKEHPHHNQGPLLLGKSQGSRQISGACPPIKTPLAPPPRSSKA